MTTRWIIVGMMAIAFLTGGPVADDLLLRGLDAASLNQVSGAQEARAQAPASLALQQADEALPIDMAAIDAYIENAMETWNVPGLGLAIVKDDRVIAAKGYGLRSVESDAPVDDRTIFAIGSTTKAFTTAALAKLVDSGELSWDDLVIDHLPEFKMFDPWVTRHMTVRDLLTHRSGLERGDLLWYAGQYDADDVIRRLRYLEPTLRFRDQFGYQNIMYAVAGQLIEAITGTSWSSHIRHSFLTPLDMYGTSTTADVLEHYQNVATPHYESGGQLQTTSFRNLDVVGAAGSINSSVHDMANWVRLQLNEGMFEGARLVSQNAIREMHNAHMIIPLSPFSEQLNPDTHFNAYGLGWFLSDYHGRKLVFHGGNIDGMSANVTLVPEEELGLVILTNKDATVLPDVVSTWIVDRFLGVPEKDWNELYYSTLQSINAQVQQLLTARRNERVEGTSPSLELDQYTGVYGHEFYGEVTITQSDDGLVFNYGAFTGTLSHWHYNTFSVQWEDPYLQSGVGVFLINFDLDTRGRVASMTAQDILEQFRLEDFQYVSELGQ